MGKRLKDKVLHARIDGEVYMQVSQYLEHVELNMGDLVREAVSEYMLNHPIKQPVEPVTIKPGA